MRIILVVWRYVKKKNPRTEQGLLNHPCQFVMSRTVELMWDWHISCHFCPHFCKQCWAFEVSTTSKSSSELGHYLVNSVIDFPRCETTNGRRVSDEFRPPYWQITRNPHMPRIPYCSHNNSPTQIFKDNFDSTVISYVKIFFVNSFRFHVGFSS